jgi:oxygen-independent coproporphyrinogen-3 oxidase
MTLPLPLFTSRPMDLDTEDPYVAYSYSYPHKSAYGPLDPPVALAPLWQAERRDSLFLYIHVPFCEMRCGFCNLFTRAGGDETVVEGYLDALERQARVLADATAQGRNVTRLALGGGTPTFLSVAHLERLLDITERFFDASPQRVPASVETSPKTATPARLQCLRERGVQRISLGVQSFVDEESHAIGRPQSLREVLLALERLRVFPRLNIDLIYGQPTQTAASWLKSLRLALSFQPEELYLYPLYVRPGTGLGRKGNVQSASSSFTRHLYREARDLLLAEGYEQISMRYFQGPPAPRDEGPVYCCQTDGMLGLGCGARSYTSWLHYSSPFAVETATVQVLIDQWTRQTEEDFGWARWGCHLSEDDRRRRFVIQSLLTRSGLVEAAYVQLFGETVLEGFPELSSLVERGFAQREEGIWHLTTLGVEFSDSIGPLLYSATNLALFEKFARP